MLINRETVNKLILWVVTEECYGGIFSLDKSDCTDKLSMVNHQVIFLKMQTNTIIIFCNLMYMCVV